MPIDQDLVELLRSGGLAVLPTDTVYGIVCLASDQDAVKRLYMLKGRQNKPGTVVASSIGQLAELGIGQKYLAEARKFWPAPVSVIVPSGSSLRYIDQGKKSLAARVVARSYLRKLLQETGPLLTSSANPPGQPPAGNIAQAKSYFADKVDYYVDGGDLSDKKPSTIIQLTSGKVKVLRPGAVQIR